MKDSNLYLGLVLPSGGWQSLIVPFLNNYIFYKWEKVLAFNQDRCSIYSWFSSISSTKIYVPFSSKCCVDEKASLQKMFMKESNDNDMEFSNGFISFDSKSSSFRLFWNDSNSILSSQKWTNIYRQETKTFKMRLILSLFRSFAVLLFCYFAILLFCYFAILLFCYFAILLFCYFAILLFCYFAILLFCYFAILLFCYFAILLYLFYSVYLPFSCGVN